VERPDKESNRRFYDTQRDDDRRRFEQQGSKRFLGETLAAWLVPQLRNGDLVLDVAGGSGVYTSQLAQATGATVVGLDISESMVRQRGDDPFLPLSVVGDMEALPFAPASFDAVIFIAALHHVPDALPALQEAWRVLRPGGRLFAREPCSLRAGKTSASPIEGQAQEFRVSAAYLADRARRAGFELEQLIALQLAMRLLGRVVRTPSLRLYRASYALDRALFLIPGLARLGEGCMLQAIKPGEPAGATRRDGEGELTALLACPVCGSELLEGGSGLSCSGCGAGYAVADGVRILLSPDSGQGAQLSEM